MPSRHRFQPTSESLEPIALLSGATMTAAVASSSLRLVLNGSADGTFTQPSSNPDAGRQYVLQGTGKVAPMGAVIVSGSFHATGFTASGRAQGTLTFSDTRGSVTLHLVGPIQKGFSPLPTTFAYSIVKGTGAFHQATGRGKATLQLFTAVIDPPAPCPPNAMCLPLPLAHRFTLTIQR